MLRLCIVGHCTECYSTAQFEKNDADTMFFAMWLHSCRRAKCEKMVASPVLADQKLLWRNLVALAIQSSHLWHHMAAKIPSFRSTALLGISQERHHHGAGICGTRLYQWPDSLHNSWHRAWEGFASLGDWNVDSTMLTFLHHLPSVLLWFIYVLLNKKMFPMVPMMLPICDVFSARCTGFSHVWYRTQAQYFGCCWIWWFCLFHTPKHGKHGNWSFVWSFYRSIYRSMDRFRKIVTSFGWRWRCLWSCFLRSADTMISGRIGDHRTRNSLSPSFLKTIFRDICAYAKGTCCRVQWILNFGICGVNWSILVTLVIQNTDISWIGHLQFVIVRFYFVNVVICHTLSDRQVKHVKPREPNLEISHGAAESWWIRNRLMISHGRNRLKSPLHPDLRQGWCVMQEKALGKAWRSGVAA